MFQMQILLFQVLFDHIERIAKALDITQLSKAYKQERENGMLMKWIEEFTVNNNTPVMHFRQGQLRK